MAPSRQNKIARVSVYRRLPVSPCYSTCFASLTTLPNHRANLCAALVSATGIHWGLWGEAKPSSLKANVIPRPCLNPGAAAWKFQEFLEASGPHIKARHAIIGPEYACSAAALGMERRPTAYRVHTYMGLPGGTTEVISALPGRPSLHTPCRGRPIGR